MGGSVGRGQDMDLSPRQAGERGGGARSGSPTYNSMWCGAEIGLCS